MIYGTILLIVAGIILFLSIEWNNPKTFGGMSFYEK
jgi:trk system potassium uptake protein TrkH